MDYKSLMQVAPLSISVDEVKAIIAEGKYNLIPIYKEIPADLETPVSAFLKIQDGAQCFLFESVEGGENLARYSFIGSNPYKVVESAGDYKTFPADPSQDPLRGVEQELAKYRVYPVNGLPDFTGGAVGYISYDCVRYFEPKVKISDENPLGIPEAIWYYCRTLVVFDHAQHKLRVVNHIYVNDDNSDTDDTDGRGPIEDMYRDAVQAIDDICTKLDNPVPVLEPHPNTIRDRKLNEQGKVDMKSNHGSEGYKGFVASLKQDIYDGNIIQAVPSHRMARPLHHVHPFDIYRQLRMLNPSPYMFYMDFGEWQTVGASPELLVKVIDNKVITHPIAGTRKRGKNKKRDDELAEELLNCEKERAEHIMLVDLGRNDVGRVSAPGTVNVDSLMHIERYSHVMHIVSHVSGQLSPDRTPYDAFRSIFPAGTVSGAPKVSAMQLVSKLENQRRGLYAGAVGYVSFSGVLDTCIAIRTLVVKDGTAYLQAGGGIVFDSNAPDEHLETVNKMRALAVAIDKAEDLAFMILEKQTAKTKKEEHRDK